MRAILILLLALLPFAANAQAPRAMAFTTNTAPVVTNIVRNLATNSTIHAEKLAPGGTLPQLNVGQTTNSLGVTIDDLGILYGESNVKWWGAVGDIFTDDTVAVSNAFVWAEAADSPVYFPPGTFRITKTLNFPVRGTVIGAGRGASQINFQPTVQSFLFNVQTNNDTLHIRDIALNNAVSAGAGIRAGAILQTETAGDLTEVIIERVNISQFTQGAIDLSSAYYVSLESCRLLSNSDVVVYGGWATNSSVAIRITGNVLSVENCRFTGNDQDMVVPLVAALSINESSFEFGGENERVGYTSDYSIDVGGTLAQAFSFTRNYTERAQTSVGKSVLRLRNADAPQVIGNIWAGSLGGITYTHTFVELSNCPQAVIEGNTFAEVLTGFINVLGTNVVRAWNNTYYDGDVKLTTKAAIAPFITYGLVELSGDSFNRFVEIRQSAAAALTVNTNSLVVTNGNTGLGISTPKLTLDVFKIDGNSLGGMPATSGTIPNGIAHFGDPTTTDLYIGENNESPYGFWLQVALKSDLSLEYPLMLNPNGGNVGIGLTNPAAKLDVAGDIRASTTITATNGFLSTNSLPFKVPTNSPTDGFLITASGASGATKWVAAGAASNPFPLYVDTYVLTNGSGAGGQERDFWFRTNYNNQGFTSLQWRTASTYADIYQDASYLHVNAAKFIVDQVLEVTGTTALNAAVTVGATGTSIANIRHGISGSMVLGSVTVTDAGCTANTRYFFSAHALGTVSLAGGYYASTRNSGTSFVITSSQATETSTIDWMAIEP